MQDNSVVHRGRLRDNTLMMMRRYPTLIPALVLAALVTPTPATAITTVYSIAETDPRVAHLPTMQPLRAALTEVSEVSVEVWSTPADVKKPRRFTMRKPEAVSALVAALDVAQPPPRKIVAACTCGGCITFTFKRPARSDLVLELRSEDYLRWVDGPWATDAAVSDTGRRAIAEWMRANAIRVEWRWEQKARADAARKALQSAVENALGRDLTAFVREAKKRIKAADDQRRADTPVAPLPDKDPVDGEPVVVATPPAVATTPAQHDGVRPGYELDWPHAGDVATGLALARVAAAHGRDVSCDDPARDISCDDLDTIRRILADFAARDNFQDLLRACEKDGRALIAFAAVFSDNTAAGGDSCAQNLRQDAYEEWSVRIAKARLEYDTAPELARVVNTLLNDSEADADGAITARLRAIAGEKTACTMYEGKRMGDTDSTLRAAVYACLPLTSRDNPDDVLSLIGRLERTHAPGTPSPLNPHETAALAVARALCGQHEHLNIHRLLEDDDLAIYSIYAYESVAEAWAVGVLVAAHNNFGIVGDFDASDSRNTVLNAIEDAILRQTGHLLPATEAGRELLALPAYTPGRRAAIRSWWKANHGTWTPPPEPRVDDTDENDAPTSDADPQAKES